MGSKRVVLHFPQSLVNRPVVCNLVKHHDLDFSILRARVTPEEEGLMVLEISGEAESLEQGMRYLTSTGVRLEPLEQDIVREEARCTHCGACVPTCGTGALAIDRPSMKVAFSKEKCVACEHCVRACPMKAIQVQF